jgi:hypothetical protein
MSLVGRWFLAVVASGGVAGLAAGKAAAQTAPDRSAVTAAAKAPFFRLALAEPLRHGRLQEVAADLARYPSKGYSGVFFENDYLRWTFQVEANPGAFCPDADAGFGGDWRMFNLFDFTRGRDRQQCRAYLAELCRRCREANLDVYASFWLPQLSGEFREYLRKNHPEALGSLTSDGRRIETLCTCREGRGLELLGGLIEEFMRDFPQVRGLKVATLDDYAFLCDESCPHAHGSGQAEHAANLFACVQRAMRRVRPDAEFLLYPWFWKPGFKDTVLPRLRPPYHVVCRFSQGARQELEPGIPGDPLFDASLVLPETMGPEFADWLRRVGPERVLDMVPVGTGMDCLFLAAPPNPVGVYRRLRALAAHGVRQIIDFDCGAHHPGSCEEVVAVFHEKPGLDEPAVLAAVAERLYRRPEARAAAIRGWQAFGRGWGQLPIGLGQTGCAEFSGRFGMAWSMCIATPLVRAAFAETDQGHKIHWFSPYNFFTPKLAERLEPCFLRVLAEWRTAADELARADALEGHTAASRREALAAEGHALCVLSALDWCAAGQVARRSDGGRRFREIQLLETNLVRRFQRLLREWPGLWDNNCWHPHHTPLSQRGLGLDPLRYHDAFAAKLAVHAATP